VETVGVGLTITVLAVMSSAYASCCPAK
jgi:hypothetical protein